MTAREAAQIARAIVDRKPPRVAIPAFLTVPKLHWRRDGDTITISGGPFEFPADGEVRISLPVVKS